MKLSDVIRHLECLASGKCVCPSSHQEAASQAVEILRRMESERRPRACKCSTCGHSSTINDPYCSECGQRLVHP